MTAARTGGIVDHLPAVGDVLPATGTGVRSAGLRPDQPAPEVRGGGVPSGTRPGGVALGGARSTAERSVEARRPRFERRSARLAGTSTADESVPLPPEPPDEDTPPDDEEGMLAELAAGEAAPAPATSDPERAAMALLTTHLGARAIDSH